MAALDKGIIREWKCMVCGEIVRGVEPPEQCPVCGVGKDKFVEVTSSIDFKSDKDEKILILGGGIAGFSAAEAARARNGKCQIEIISDEDVFCYNRPMLTKGLIADFDADKFFSKQLDWYEEHNVQFTLGTTVSKIDTENKVVTFENGETREYDKLIYALGAESNKIPLDGSDLPGVYVIRKLADANAIREKLDTVKNVVVIGGGILGIEAAWEFTRAGKGVTVLDIGPRIMGRQLDQDAAELLVSAIEKSGGEVITEAAIDGIKGDDQVTGVALKDGRVIQCEMVIISAGVKTNVQVGLDGGLKGDRFIEVNDHMETSAKDVYACGDVAVCNGVSIGIWTQADAMGKVAGANAAGDQVTYGGIVPSTSFIGFDTAIFSMGDVGGNPDKKYDIKMVSLGADKFIKLYFLDDAMCGGILFGDTSKTIELMHGVKEKISVEDDRVFEILGM